MAKTNEDQTKGERPDKSDQTDDATTIPFNVGGILSGLGGLVEKLGELAEAGEKLSRSGEFKDASGKLRGVYGINVKTGLGNRGEPELKVEPFGTVHRKATGKPVGEDIREPLVDVHEEEDHVLVLAEIPGVSKENVQLDLVSDDRLALCAKRGEITYRKEVTLPGNFSQQKMNWDCKNGILKIRLER